MAKRNWIRNPARHLRNPLDVGIEIGDVRVEINGAALRDIMKSEGAQEAVNKAAQSICDAANIIAANPEANYIVHPRVLKVSAHAFVDCENYPAYMDENENYTLEKAFWSH